MKLIEREDYQAAS